MYKIIGVDIGGTKISVVLGTSTGRILEKHIIKTRTRTRTHECIKDIVKTIESVISDKIKDRNTFGGIGVCIPGPIGDDPYIIKNAPNLPGWNGINIGGILKRKFRCPVFCNNDANAACIAEKLFGHGKKVKDFLYVTISTGIGSGVIIDNALVMGASNSAGELGHCVVEPRGPRCNCGKVGCLEVISSGTAIAQFANALKSKSVDLKRITDEYAYYKFNSLSRKTPLRLTDKSKLFRIQENVAAKDVADLACSGDRLAQYIYFRAGFYFGIAITHILQIINPQMIALGGSVTKTGPLYFTPMRQAIAEYSWNDPRRYCKIIKAKLGDAVGDFGALSLVVDN